MAGPQVTGSSKLALYWHTLRYLKPIQFYGRLKRHFPTLSVSGDIDPGLRPQTGVWSDPVPKPEVMLDKTTFRFLNNEVGFETNIDWQDASSGLLWLYNLHYFDVLASPAADADLLGPLIVDWIEVNAAGEGVGWQPYPTSLRIVNWIKWALAGNPLQTDWQASLATQARVLSQRIEWDLLGNHLFANAKALIFAGTLLDGREANAWRTKGLEILRHQLREQVLPDGGHFERSPMYHAIILEDVLDLLNLARAFPDLVGGEVVEHMEAIGPAMLTWLEAMSHPDGQISFFNDAALSSAPDLAALKAYAGRLKLGTAPPLNRPVHNLAESGYLRLEQGDAVALLDVAPVGPDCQPGHAHADTLSFELSVGGERVIVNSGTSQYGLGPERQRQRSTAAHSTVEIDGADSSEVWAGFRVARRANPFDLSIGSEEGTITVSCSHDGYCRLPERPVHQRNWKIGSGVIEIADTVSGPQDRAVARFYFHPAVRPVWDGASGTLELANGGRLTLTAATGSGRLCQSTYHPEFGKSLPSSCLEVLLDEGRACLNIAW